MRTPATVAAIIVSIAIVGGCSAATPDAPNTPSTATTPAGIVSERCTRCHTLSRIKAASQDAAAWKVTTDRMRGKGAQISDAEQEQIIEFLAGGGAAGL